jgi:hypothetical protein
MDILRWLGIWLLINFDLAMFICGIIAMVIHRSVDDKIPQEHIIFRWMLIFGVVLPFLYGFVIHGWFTYISSATILYTPNPYHDEVAIMDLVFALFALGAFRARFGYRLAITLVATGLMWTDVFAHAYEMYIAHDFNLIINAGLAVNFIVPLILLITVRKFRLK